jgi:hypothetical protein
MYLEVHVKAFVTWAKIGLEITQLHNNKIRHNKEQEERRIHSNKIGTVRGEEEEQTA